MRARAKLDLTVLAAALLAACAPEPPAAPVGVGPASNPAPSAAGRAKLELARPEPPAAAVPAAEPIPTPAAAPAAKPAVIGPDIADLGPFDVISWDEAKARAEAQIQSSNADAELEKIRAELENRP